MTIDYRCATNILHKLINMKLGATFSKLSEFMMAFFEFAKNFFSYLCKLVQPIRCTYTDHMMQSSQFQKSFGKVVWKTSSFK